MSKISRASEMANDKPKAKITLAPPTQIQTVWRYGSYCDSTLYENAIIVQKKNSLIIDPPMPDQTRSWAVGLAPWSESPLAIIFKTGLDAEAGQQKSTGVAQIVRPGEIIRPVGLRGSFSGILYGLPYGWLGGGATTLIIFKTPDSVIDWGTTRSEIMFHQFRIPLYQTSPGAPIPATMRKNWPLRFPWANAYAGINKIPVTGSPILDVRPTRTVFRLRTDNLASDLTVRLVMQSVTDLDVTADGTTVGTDLSYTEFTFKANEYGYPGAGFPTFVMDQSQIGSVLGSQVGGIALLTDQAIVADVDVCRYGTL